MNRSSLAGAPLLATVTGPAAAPVLPTPPLAPGSPRFVDCTVLNVGAAPVTVAVEMVAGKGNVIGPVAVVLAPGTFATPTTSSVERYCRFTVMAGKKNALRGVIRVLDGFGVNSVVAVAEAR